MVSQINMLGICASPRKNGNSMLLLENALEAAKEVSGVTIQIFDMRGKNFKHCIACDGCSRNEVKCILKGDDFEDFFEKWSKADAVVVATPIYHMNIPSNLKAALDRLGNSILSMYPGQQRRPLKAGAAIAQGANRFGGQEFAMQSIINSFLLMNCLPVAGDIPHSYIGVGGSTYGDTKAGLIASNESAILSARNIGKRVAELAKIINAGKASLRDELPEEYYLTI